MVLFRNQPELLRLECTNVRRRAARLELLHLTVRRRLEAGRTAAADATSTTPEARAALTAVARDCGAPAFAVDSASGPAAAVFR